MEALKPKHWIFLVPEDGANTYILYAPLHKLAVRVSQEARDSLMGILDEQEPVNTSEKYMYQFLEERGLLNFPQAWHPQVVRERAPGNKYTVSLTNKCNLRCIYCYAETGLDFQTMPWEVAQAAIDSLVRETLASQEKKFAITFHGGGEVFMEYPLVQRCVTYARELAQENDLKVSFSAVTNTTLITPERALWLKEVGFKKVTVSLDGVQPINDLQRPKANGDSSFEDVMAGIRNLTQAEIPFSIRSTVTDMGVPRMQEFVEFVAEHILPNGGKIHFEPMSLCGRACGTKLATNSTAFMENYLLARELGSTLGLEVISSMDSFKQEKKRFCGASCGTMFCVAPCGKVSACSRVTKDADTGAEMFFYGNYDTADGTFSIDEKQQARIVQHGILPAKCEECFARWNCQGDCPMSRYAYGEHHEEACAMTQQILKDALRKEVDQANKKGG